MAFANLPCRCVFKNYGSGTNDRFSRNGYVISDAGIDSYKAVILDGYTSGNRCTRRNEAVIPDRRVMANVAAAPKDDITAYACKWLNDGMLKDEAVVAWLKTGIDICCRTYVAYQRVTTPLGFSVLGCPHLVYPGVSHRHEHGESLRRKCGRNLIERNDRQIAESFLLTVGRIDCKGNRLVGAIVGQVKMGEFSGFSRTENYDAGWHAYRALR